MGCGSRGRSRACWKIRRCYCWSRKYFVSQTNIKTIHTDLAVIGAGPGGYAAAFHAADKGMKVTLIDTKPNPGGVCTFIGCIPSKALLHAARVLDEANHADSFGV